MKVAVLGNMSQRLSAQIHLCKELLCIDPSLEFTFILNSKKDFEKFKFSLQPFSYIVYDTNESNEKSTKSGLDRKKINIKSLLKWVQYLSIYEIYSMGKIFLNLRKKNQWMKKNIESIQPDIAISNGDRHGELEPAFLKQCNKSNIFIVVPYLTYSGSEGPLLTQIGRRLVDRSWRSPLITHLLCFFMKGQLYKKKYLFYNPSMILALKLFGTLSKNPWQMGCGKVNRICVDSQHTYNRYKKNGVPISKMRIIGDISTDELYKSFKNKEELRGEIIKKYSLDPSKKIMICAIPQLYEHDRLDIDSHWNEIYFLLESFCRNKHNVLLSLHPKMNREIYMHLEKKFPCRILDEKLMFVLPISDLFIADFSSTIIWATLSRVPSIIVDFYGYNYDVFNFLESVSIINEKAELESKINEVMKLKPDFSNDWKQLSRDDVFNGKTTARYYEIIKEGALKT